VVESRESFYLTSLLIHDFCLKFQILARVVPKGLLFFWKGKAVYEGVRGQLILPHQSDVNWLFQLLDVSVPLRIDDRLGVGPLDNEGVDMLQCFTCHHGTNPYNPRWTSRGHASELSLWCQYIIIIADTHTCNI
jgi:hypothetical protein